MTDLMKIQNTMSSVQIAELTGKLHKHVMRDIRNMADNLSQTNEPKSGPVNYSSYVIKEDTYKDSKGELRAMFSLNKKACFLLASGYDVLLRAKIIDRWEELETEKMMQDLPSYQISSPRERAMKWIEEEEVRQQLALENKQLTEETFTLHKLEVRRLRLYQSLAKSKENNTYDKVIKDIIQCEEELIDYLNNIH